MAGTNGIDIVLFHGNNIGNHLLSIWNTTKHRAKLMTVYPLKYNALSIQKHDSVHHLKSSEAYILSDKLKLRLSLIQDRDFHPIQVWNFCTPEQWFIHRQLSAGHPGFSIHRKGHGCYRLSFSHFIAIVLHREIPKLINGDCNNPRSSGL